MGQVVKKSASQRVKQRLGSERRELVSAWSQLLFPMEQAFELNVRAWDSVPALSSFIVDSVPLVVFQRIS